MSASLFGSGHWARRLLQLLVRGGMLVAGALQPLLGLRKDSGFHDLHHLIQVIGDSPDGQVVGGDGVQALKHYRVHPVGERLPETPAEENDGDGIIQLPRLHQCDELEELVKGAKAAGKEDIRLGGEIQHDLAAEEVVKADRAAHKGIDALLMGQLDIDADRIAASVPRAVVSRLHDTRAAACHDSVTLLSKTPPQLVGLLTIRPILGHPCRTEDGNAMLDVAQKGKATDELTHDTENAPAWCCVEVGVISVC